MDTMGDGVATIRKIPSGKWRAWIRLQQLRKPLTRTFDRKRDAQHWATEIEADLRAGRYRDPSSETLSELVTRHEANRPSRVTTDAHWRTQLNRLRWWAKQLPGPACEITRADVIRLREEIIASGKAPATANRWTRDLSALLTRAWRDWDVLPNNPTAGIGNEPERESTITVNGVIREPFLEKEERARLAETCYARRSHMKGRSANDLGDLVVLALASGARQGELLTLRWRQVLWDRKRLHLPFTKTKPRHVAVFDQGWEVLRRRNRIRKIDSDLVFPAPRARRPTFPRRHWEAARAKAGFPDLRFHHLRHTHATLMAPLIGSLADLMLHMGWSSSKMAERYVHLLESRADEVVAAHPDLIFPRTISRI
jgi:integrase